MTVAVFYIGVSMLKFFCFFSVILLISWMVLIFNLSAENADTSSKTSGRIVDKVIHLLIPDYENLSDNEQREIKDNFQFVIRKTAHFTIYGILGVFAFLSMATYKNIPIIFRLISPAFVCLIYSVSDELHQRLVPGRSGELRDVLIDFCGSLLGITAVFLITRLKPFKKFI